MILKIVWLAIKSLLVDVVEAPIVVIMSRSSFTREVLTSHTRIIYVRQEEISHLVSVLQQHMDSVVMP
jgi:hypothetical protein